MHACTISSFVDMNLVNYLNYTFPHKSTFSYFICLEWVRNDCIHYKLFYKQSFCKFAMLSWSKLQGPLKEFLESTHFELPMMNFQRLPLVYLNNSFQIFLRLNAIANTFCAVTN